MPSFELTQIITPDKPTRYSANGKRVSKDRYEEIERLARMFGRHECFTTRAKQLDGGTFKRWNYSYCSW